jgi:hypothetical protein
MSRHTRYNRSPKGRARNQRYERKKIRMRVGWRHPASTSALRRRPKQHSNSDRRSERGHLVPLYATREQRKHAAVRRAQFPLETALRRIDYLEDVVKPELQALAEGRARIDSKGNYVEDAKAALEPGELPS